MIIENLKVVFSKRAAQIKNKEEKKKFEQMVETILDTYKGITATDGQALACPTSYRKKGLIFGKWSRTKEAAYEKLLDGTYTYADVESLFPPTKPFAYGHSFKSTRVENAPISQVKVNTQLKNSEYLLVLAEALMSNLDENKPNLLRAIYNVMEESAKKDRTKGIDTVVFVSNVKTGISEVIDINNAKTTEEAEEILRKAIYNEDGSYTEAVVELDAEDYSIQQDLPDHYRNHD